MNIFGENPRFYVGEVVYDPGGTLGPRRQQNLQLVYVWMGEAHISVSGNEYRLGPNEGTLLLPGHEEYFAFAVNEPTHHGWCEVCAPELPAECRLAYAALPRVVRLSARLIELVSLANDLKRETGDNVMRLRDSLAAAVLHEFLRLAGLQLGEERPYPEPLRRALAFLHEHFDGACSLAVLARQAGVSSQHLARLFRQHLGQTPAQVLWDLRTREGLRLLRDSGLSVAEVAYRSGFQTPAHFSRRLKEQTGLAPREYRQRAWSQSPRR